MLLSISCSFMLILLKSCFNSISGHTIERLLKGRKKESWAKYFAQSIYEMDETQLKVRKKKNPWLDLHKSFVYDLKLTKLRSGLESSFSIKRPLLSVQVINIYKNLFTH